MDAAVYLKSGSRLPMRSTDPHVGASFLPGPLTSLRTFRFCEFHRSGFTSRPSTCSFCQSSLLYFDIKGTWDRSFGYCGIEGDSRTQMLSPMWNKIQLPAYLYHSYRALLFLTLVVPACAQLPIGATPSNVPANIGTPETQRQKCRQFRGVCRGT